MLLLEALYDRMPSLRAREQMSASHATALGSGTLKPEDHRKAWRALISQAGFSASRRPATPANLRALGIEVKR